MQIDRRIPAGITQERDHPLRFAQRVTADDMRALGKRRDRAQQPSHLVERLGVLEHRQPERCLGDQQVALGEFEGLCRAVRQPLVVAGDDDALPAMLHHHLR
jgi:hypothetical protein